MPTILLDDDRFGPCLRLTHENASALVALNGGQVLSWCAHGMERLFVAGRAPPSAGGAVRGGIPVIFPQFAGNGPGPRHGFARNARWSVVETSPRDDAAVAALRLRPDARIAAAWPHAFALELRVALTATALEITLDAHNPGPAAWPFSAALHTYLAVDAVRIALPADLATHPFADRSEAGDGSPATGPLDPAHEIERLYRDVPRHLDWTLPAPLRMTSDGWPDLMVWNPGPLKAAALADLDPGDHRRFLCVEPLRHDPRPLAPGSRWRATHRLETLP